MKYIGKKDLWTGLVLLFKLMENEVALILIRLYQGGEGGLPGTPYDGLYREVLPKRGIFFRLYVCESVGISLVEVDKRGGKSVIWVCERTQKC